MSAWRRSSRFARRSPSTRWDGHGRERVLHPEFNVIVEYLAGRGVKLSIASNGYSLTVMPDAVLRAFHDVEVSIDFATEAEQDAFRGAGNWALVHQASERCRAQGSRSLSSPR